MPNIYETPGDALPIYGVAQANKILAVDASGTLVWISQSGGPTGPTGAGPTGPTGAGPTGPTGPTGP